MSEVLNERLERVNDDAMAALAGLYGERGPEVWDHLVAVARRLHSQRSVELLERDRRREADRGWFLDPAHVGYKAYADRFGGTLRGVADRIPHLEQLGVTFLHLMSVLKPRAGESDGGYAIDDYTVPDPKLGTVDDLERLASALGDHNINLIIDLVLNHTSDQHEWARKARAGSEYHRALYLTFPDRDLPDQYERSLPEVFPTMAPGNFTWVPGWVDDRNQYDRNHDDRNHDERQPSGKGQRAARPGRSQGERFGPPDPTGWQTPPAGTPRVSLGHPTTSTFGPTPNTFGARPDAGVSARVGSRSGVGPARRGDATSGRWVWTTFREFQWDLNWANPAVMIEMASIALELANLGISVLRLDAIAFTWKRLGTDCQNQPEAHLIGQALRAVLEVAAPSTLLLAEAIVGPSDLVGYLGGHEFERSECHLAYHNQLMVQGWSLLASREIDLAKVALNGLPTPPSSTTWFTYVRNHDDIGWAIDDQHAADVGLDGLGHRRFLAEFYRGDFPGSFARGTPFSSNEAAADERTSGMAATLAGLTDAIERADPERVDDALARHRLLHALAFGWGGIPLLYMGDEFAQLDAPLDAAGAVDSRWLNRPWWSPELARQAETAPESIPGRALRNMIGLGRARARCRPLHGGARSVVIESPRGTFAWRRRHPRYGELLGVANPGRVEIDASALAVVAPSGGRDALGTTAERLWQLGAYEVRWITDAFRA